MVPRFISLLLASPSGSDWQVFYCVPLRIMSFLTDFTPLTPLATATALLISARDLTKPVSCTMPLNVSTLISADLSEGSSSTAAFTLVVITASSTYSPGDSFFASALGPAPPALWHFSQSAAALTLNAFLPSWQGPPELAF